MLLSAARDGSQAIAVLLILVALAVFLIPGNIALFTYARPDSNRQGLRCESETRDLSRSSRIVTSEPSGRSGEATPVTKSQGFWVNLLVRLGVRKKSVPRRRRASRPQTAKRPGRALRRRRKSPKGGRTRVARRVFVSFDYDNDLTLKEFIIGQARLADSPFEVQDHSLKEAAPQLKWEEKARAAIARAEVFIVMLGPRTRFAPGVRKEVAMAKALAKTRFQIIGYRDGSADWAVQDGGPVYRWDWDNLKRLLA